MNYFLHDLEVTTVGDESKFNCSHTLGDGLIVQGENISFKKDTHKFSHYALATLMPYIAAKQRVEQKSDWMYFASEIACPDPLCGARFRIKRTKKRIYEYNSIIEVNE